jgi:hypothetical protein
MPGCVSSQNVLNGASGSRFIGSDGGSTPLVTISGDQRNTFCAEQEVGISEQDIVSGNDNSNHSITPNVPDTNFFNNLGEG